MRQSDFDVLLENVRKAESELLKRNKSHPLVAYYTCETDRDRENGWQALLRVYMPYACAAAALTDADIELAYAKHLEALTNALQE
jgi:hypothetical protein